MKVAPLGIAQLGIAPTSHTLAGETVQLLRSGALYWPAESILFVADPHFGKAATFRARGVPVPVGTTAETLARLDASVEATGAKRIVVLGDFVHARLAAGIATLDTLVAWRARRAALGLAVVTGNHDRHAGRLPVDLGIERLAPGVRFGPFAALHEPAYPREGYGLAGHVHPVVALHDRTRSRLRVACFWETAGHIVLPAFGAFTGGAEIVPAPGDRVWVVDR